MQKSVQWERKDRPAIIGRLVSVLSEARKVLLKQLEEDQKKLRELQATAQKRGV